MENNNNQMMLNVANEDLIAIKELELNIKELKEVAAYEINKINKKLEAVIEPFEEKINKHKANILVFCSSNEMKETKTKKKKILLDGTIELIKSKKIIANVEDKILDWTIKNRPEFVETKLVEKKRAMWKEIKENLDIVDDKIIDKITGEIIECEAIGIIEKPQELKIIY